MIHFSHGDLRPSTVFTPIAFAFFTLYSSIAAADDELDVIEVHGKHLDAKSRLGSTAQLLKKQGVDFSAAGGMSDLPILNGMMGDRVKVLVDGADVTAACANHMNPPLSYISASQIQATSVIAGISPVSVAGDNIAGVISVNSMAPKFNDSDSLSWHSGYASGEYRSINQGKSFGVGASWASSAISLEYQGTFDDAKSYDDGHGDKVLDTLYRGQNHSLTAAFRDDKQQLSVKLSHQAIPFQGFANQYMDMTDNNSLGVTSQYLRQIDNGEFEAQLNWYRVKHEMGFFTEEKTGMMPMKTDAEDVSYKLQWTIQLANNQRLKLGHAYFDYSIDDWWPAIEGSMMMGPNDYVNINNGQRQRLAAFVELEQELSAQWQLSSGLRIEYVRANAGEVQGYMDATTDMDHGMHSGMGTSMGMGGMTDVNSTAAMAFNALDREQSHTLIDASLLARYKINANETIELGLARKNRAPNLYESYSWGRSVMATTMIGWFGGGNGYLGDANLTAETAHTLSASYQNVAIDDDWQFSANIWFTQVSDYIDVKLVDNFNNGPNDASKRHILQFTNIDATLYGSHLEAMYKLADSQSLGQIKLKADLTTTHGERDQGDEPLYQIKPLQGEISLLHKNGEWQNSLVWQWVGKKDRVDERRLENSTDSYHLINLNSQTTWGKVNLLFSITNLLDEYYQLPLGGVSIAQYKQDNTQGFMQLAGEGRSFNFGLSYQF